MGEYSLAISASSENIRRQVRGMVFFTLIFRKLPERYQIQHSTWEVNEGGKVGEMDATGLFRFMQAIEHTLHMRDIRKGEQQPDDPKPRYPATVSYESGQQPQPFWPKYTLNTPPQRGSFQSFRGAPRGGRDKNSGRFMRGGTRTFVATQHDAIEVMNEEEPEGAVEAYGDVQEEEIEDVEQADIAVMNDTNVYDSDEGVTYTAQAYYERQNTMSSCKFCKDSAHRVGGNCSKFMNMTPTSRRDWAMNNKACLNCLADHFASACPSSGRCQVPGCEKKHHTSLHGSERREVQFATPVVKRSQPQTKL